MVYNLNTTHRFSNMPKRLHLPPEERAFLERLGLITTEAEVISEYTFEPNGAPNVEREANGKPPFLHRRIVTREVLKKIIITDTDPKLKEYLTDAGLIDQTNKYVRFYALLSRLGCKIYIWNGVTKKINLLNENELLFQNLIYNFEQITPILPRKLFQLTKFSPDNVCIADSTYHTILNTQYIEDTGQKNERDFSNEFLYQDKFEFNQLKHCRELEFADREEKLEFPPGSHLNFLYALHLWRTDEIFSEQIINLAPHLGKLMLDGCNFIKTSELFENKETHTLILVRCKLSLDFYFRFLKAFPNLKTIKIRNCDMQNTSDEPLFFPSMPQLKMLDIEYTPPQYINIISKLINSTVTHLKIVINQFKQSYEDNDLFLPQLSATQLHGLTHFSLHDFEGKKINDYLKKLPVNLTSLNIKSYYYSWDDIIENLTRFPLLENIVLEIGNGPSPEQAQKILKKFPQAKLTSLLSEGEKKKEERALARLHHSFNSKSARPPPAPIEDKRSRESKIEYVSFTDTGQPNRVRMTLDFNTGPPKAAIYSDPILFETNDPTLNDPTLYRLQVFNHLNPETVDPYTEYKWQKYTNYVTAPTSQENEEKTNPLYVKLKTPSKIVNNLAYSSITLMPNLKEKQLLYSLNTNEKLTDIQVISDDPNASVEIFYDKNLKVYGATVKSDAPVKLRYLLDVNRQEYDEKTSNLPKNIKDDIAHFKKCEVTEFPDSKDMSKKEWLAFLEKKPIGTCVHRSFAGFSKLKKSFKDINPGYQVNLITNVSHAYLDIIQPNGEGITVNLGGARSEHRPAPFNKKRTMTAWAAAARESPSPAKDQTDMRQYEQKPLKINQTTKELFFSSIFENSEKPILLLLPSATHIQNLSNAATDYFREAKTDYCFVDDLDELTHASTKLFLQQAARHPENPAIIFIRIDKDKKLKPQHIGLNSLFENPPKLHGAPLPPQVRIVGLAENDVELAEDIQSRLLGRIIPVTTIPKEEDVVALTQILADEEKIENAINLHKTLDWEKILLGQMILKDGHSIFKPGKLLEFLAAMPENKAKSLSLTLINPPWNLPEFNVFWNKLCKERRFFINDRFYNLPENLKLNWTTQDFIPLPSITISTLEEKNVPRWEYALNQETFKNFFYLTSSNTAGVVTQEPGYFDRHTNKEKEMSILVTEEISEAQWCELIIKATECNCKLHFVQAPGVELPNYLITKPLPAPKMLESKPDSPVKIITSNDPDFIAKTIPESEVITIGKESGYQLIEHWTAGKVGDRKAYFNNEGLIIKLLKAGKNVVLKGDFSPTFIQRISTLFSDPPYLIYNGNKLEIGPGKPLPGKLFIVSETNPFTFIGANEHKEITQDDYLRNLPSHTSSRDVALLKKLCERLKITIQYYSQIEEMLENLKNNPTKNPAEWLLLLSNNADIPALLSNGQAEYEKLNLAMPRTIIKPAEEKREEKITDELQLRINETQSRLDKLPFVFLLGPSGTGKSTTILNAFPTVFPTTPPLLEHIAKWANDKEGDDMKILFIDEANVEKDGLYLFAEGMLKDPPEIIYQGEKFELTKKHKIIFAGNYHHYDNRHLQKLFLKYDSVQHFPPFSPEYAFKKFVAPMIAVAFKDSITQDEDTLRVTTLFKSIEAHVKEIVPNINLTVRNFQSMAMALVELWKGSPEMSDKVKRNETIDLFARWVFYQNARDLLSVNNAEALKSSLFGNKSEYDRIKKTLPRIKKGFIGPTKEFYITSLHKRSLAILQEEMKIRDLRYQAGKAIEFFGTRGTLLEGPPGVGKSSIVIKLLENMGFANGLTAEAKTDEAPKIYFHIKTTDIDTMREQLITAFHKGAVVIFDEINGAGALLENVLNPLLMGRDLEGKTAKKPGFYIIGTQNPTSVGGRANLSPALENRFRKTQLSDYNRNDLEYFIMNKYKIIYNNETVREHFITKYLQERNNIPRYSFRKLLKDLDFTQTKLAAENLMSLAAIKNDTLKALLNSAGSTTLKTHRL